MVRFTLHDLAPFGGTILVKRLFVMFLLVSLFNPANASSQGEVRLASLNIELWPEYDRPDMLVIYNATLSSEVSYPVEVNFRIPAAAEIHAVAVGTEPNTVGDVPYDRRINGSWAVISFTAALPAIQFEYYDPALRKEGPLREYEYQWPGDFGVETFAMRVQQPAEAESLRLSPDIGSPAPGGDGLLYHHVDVGSLAAGDTFSLSLEYQKESDALTRDSQIIQPSGPVSQGTPGRVDVQQVLSLVLALLGVAFIFGGVIWFWLSRREQTASKSRRGRRAVRLKTAEEETNAQVYCHHCGKRAGPNDRFCRSCGTRLRGE